MAGTKTSARRAAARKPVAKAEESVPQAKNGRKQAMQKRAQGKRR